MSKRRTDTQGRIEYFEGCLGRVKDVYSKFYLSEKIKRLKSNSEHSEHISEEKVL